MEDGSNGPLSDVEVSEITKNGVVAPIMANFPEGTVAVNNEYKLNSTEPVKVNGEVHTEENNIVEPEHSSESDALVIDETVAKPKTKKKRVSKSKSPKDTEVVPHSNPYFNESIFELSQQHQQSQEQPQEETKAPKNKRKAPKTKPKLREYAQYLGLQPTVQFKCSKCGLAGFESLQSLNEHVVQCTEIRSVQDIQPDNNCAGFKLTRKVFLCSACGTYYENWNLYMHMLEFHRRYICLYCLGMFSVLEDLCQHIQVKHNLEPGYKNTPDEFFNAYNEPCYVVCCECNNIFNEQDNFFYHDCMLPESRLPLKNKSKASKQQITPENHVTGDSGDATIVPDSEFIKDSDCSNKISSENIESSDCNKDISVNNLEVKVENETQPEMTKSKSDDDNFDENNESNLTNCSDNSGEVDMDKSDDNDNLDVNLADDRSQDSDPADEEMLGSPEPIETRKVPKLSLKLPKPGTYQDYANEDSNDSCDKNEAMDIEDQVDSENENDAEDNVDAETEEPKPEDEHDERQSPSPVSQEPKEEEQEKPEQQPEEEEVPVEEPPLQIAGNDVAIIELELEQPLDKFDIRVLLQKCLRATISACIFCNHARKIAVNGKQLGLHAIAEHRFSAVVNSITAEELIPESFVARIRDSLDELDKIYFNLESGATDDAVTFSHLFECFQCRYSTTVHKELYLHNRKMHAKNLLLCIICKSNFYSYSELVCHLCPGVYAVHSELTYRCCMCVSNDLPSSFRLMVHLRKRHHACDVCLELCHNQYRLSNHVWKHKLLHFCYRCGIAYRNKPDITRHLFWKHGTESVLCKKCLVKKWPHVYHFCIPPTSFTCEECSLVFSRPVALKVHKRIHTDEKPHACTVENCTEKFISKKLLQKHEERHRAPPVEVKVDKVEEDVKSPAPEEEKPPEEKVEEKPKPKIDVYDLPALNLSESDSSDSEDETAKVKSEAKTETQNTEEVKIDNNILPDILTKLPDEQNAQAMEVDKPAPVIEDIWDNFKNYQANKDKLDQIFNDSTKVDSPPKILDEPIDLVVTAGMALKDHDYCIDPENKPDMSIVEVKPALTLSDSVDHDYCSPKTLKPSHPHNSEEPEAKGNEQDVKIEGTPRKRSNSSSSDSSSDSDSSCTCGSNCSCTSSSGSSSSSSDSSGSDSSTEEGRRKQIERREKRRERQRNTRKSESKPVDVVSTDPQQVAPPVNLVDAPIHESDLDTTESETDEEFYDKNPQLLAKKRLEEKRNQILEEVGCLPNGDFIESTSRPPTPPPGQVDEEDTKPKKKSKSKKRKKKKSERKESENGGAVSNEVPNIPDTYYQQYHQKSPPTVAPITLSLSRNSPLPTITPTYSASPINNSGTSPFHKTPMMQHQQQQKMLHESQGFARRESTDSSLRASKRRRVPNKFYGYSSDEEEKEKAHAVHTPKWRKTETATTPRSPMVVPPITIKNPTHRPPVASPLPPIEPIQIRHNSGEMRVNRVPPIKLMPRPPVQQRVEDSATDSNDSDAEPPPPPQPLAKANQPQLYCYCQCPYDEVSEMIGCDSSDCSIEWFHFECVGIMVPPKGQWFCPDCRKKKQMRRELLQQT
ncbi:uncharacterized protein LOC109597200 isoform X2 [Aethina tumida]|uniref:uncharacterized protein LOC109597200 isoform X2 n=1 Tax=Aethina tumida TaxID=116153 RepID=UPI0021496565|nr:uncharacterized protein LOC109597200 isoform X2 [Aethina tumida]